jgi:phage regulator Rha-like protein
MKSRGIIKKAEGAALAVTAQIARQILVIRGQKVMIDADLAALYGVSTKRLNQQIKRNAERFPKDFVFQLSRVERDEVVANCDHLRRLKFSPTMPFAFTEHGALMAASVLNTPRAVEVSLYVVRAFVELRETLATHKKLAKRLDELESRLERKLATHDQAISGILEAIRQLMALPEPAKRRRIGFLQSD